MEETGTRSYFLRAVRVVPVEERVVIGPGHPESGEDLDRWRDALNTGDESLIAEPERPEFRAWAARTVENRSAYGRMHPTSPHAHEDQSGIPF